MKQANFIGVGDTHFDHRSLMGLMPDYNQRQLRKLGSIAEIAVRKGIPNIVQYGDVCETDFMSLEVMTGLLTLVHKHPEVNWFFLKGNHDHRDANNSALHFLANMSEIFDNLQVAVDKPLDMRKSHGFVMHPWKKDKEYKTASDFWNIMHIDAPGAKYETGKTIERGFESEHPILSGHLHVAQQVRNSHYCGSLSQVHFIEPWKKYFHVIQGSRVKAIQTHPSYMLKNVVVRERSDLRKIDELNAQANELGIPAFYKVLLDDVTLRKTVEDMSGVVDVKVFKGKGELKHALAEIFRLPDNVVDDTDIQKVMESWLRNRSVPADLMKRTQDTHDEIYTEIAGS